MIKIAWYNVVAIVVGVMFVGFFIWLLNRDVGSGIGAGLSKVFLGITGIALASVFYAILGGIFWW